MANDPFDEAENVGRDKALKALLSVPSLFEAEDYDDYEIKPAAGKAEYDFEIRDRDTNQLVGVIEAKDRKFKSFDNRLLKQGAQMEAKKYDALLRIVEDRVIPAFFISTFEDNKFYVWDVEKTNITKDSRMCNRTTAVLTEKVEKACCYFPLNEALFTGQFQ